jgi:hypothetical protein
MVRTLMGPPNTRLWCDRIAPEGELPSDRHPDCTKRAIVLEAIKVWPGNTEVAGRPPRRPTLTASARDDVSRTGGSGRGNGFQIEQGN